MNRCGLTIDQLTSLLSYDQESGHLTWVNPTSRRVRPGGRAGCLHPDGYRTVAIDGHGYREHHICWAIANGKFPALHLDHVNGDRSDNRLINLRLATISENAQNRKFYRNRYAPGVHRLRSGNYAARVMAEGKVYRLGSFPDMESAHQAYLKEKARLHPYWKTGLAANVNTEAMA